MYEGAPNYPDAGSLLGDHREVPGQHLLHGADGDPRVHQVGRPVAAKARSVEPAAARHRRRADQSRSLDVVSRSRSASGRCPIVDTWWQTETGHDHDHAAARRHRHQARLGDAAASRASSPRSSTSRASRSPPTQGGLLVIRKPWPAMLRTIYGDHERYQAAVLEPDPRHATSPATAPAATRTATSGSWAAWMTCSTSPAIA